MAEIDAAFAYVYGKLSGDVALQALQGQRVYEGQAPVGTAFPCTIYQWQGGGDDVVLMGGARSLCHLLILVKVTGEGGSVAPLTAINDRIDALLHQSHGVAGGHYQEWVRRSPWRLAPQDGGVSYQQIGGLYEALIHPST